MGLGRRMGQGKHWMSWIHLDDLVGVILHCSHHTNLHGAINGTSPNPVTNKTFTKTLGKVLERPAILPMPGLLLKLLMG
jgi:NAD dependent epimerase/dehydratase family enzyme